MFYLKKEQDAIGIHIPPQWLSSARLLAERLGEWGVVEVDPDLMLKAHGFAVYLADSEGFANDKGDPVPLAGARLFESAAAFRTIASRGWPNAAVVSANVEIVELAQAQSCAFHDLGLLGHGLALKQAQRLRDAAPDIQEPAASKRRRL